MKSNKKMMRVLQGDVGSGKTVLALISSYLNYLSNYQSAIMVPTEILAIQHYKFLKKYLKIKISKLNYCQVKQKLKIKKK